MQYKRFEDYVVLSLDHGDDIHGSIREVCRKEQITNGSLEGFGGISRIKVGIWNNHTDGYDYLEVDDRDMEIISMIGNVTMLNDEAFTHIHVTVSDNSFRVFGGHLVDGTIQNLAEVVIHIIPGRIDRKLRGQWYVMDMDK
jgi:hypothetical protein